MAKIGNWGRYLKFEVSDSCIQTFDNLKRDIKIRTKKHNMAGGEKPKVEMLGADLEEVTIPVTLNALLGASPRRTEQKLISAAKNGTIAPLVIGGNVIIQKAMITSMSDTYDLIWRRGQVVEIKMNITFTEYN